MKTFSADPDKLQDPLRQVHQRRTLEVFSDATKQMPLQEQQRVRLHQQQLLQQLLRWHYSPLVRQLMVEGQMEEGEKMEETLGRDAQ
uniref:Somatic embryogenesis receptor kinase 2 n=1 Tax=Rhizophora mucronata TaxID=61149 RepID=A0A2P2QMV1_RHIMU